MALGNEMLRQSGKGFLTRWLSMTKRSDAGLSYFEIWISCLGRTGGIVSVVWRLEFGNWNLGSRGGVETGGIDTCTTCNA